MADQLTCFPSENVLCCDVCLVFILEVGQNAVIIIAPSRFSEIHHEGNVTYDFGRFVDIRSIVSMHQLLGSARIAVVLHVYFVGVVFVPDNVREVKD